MLKVKTKVGESPIKGAGIGLFADEFIPKGTIVWEYSEGLDREYTEEQFSKISGLEKKFLEKYCFKYLGKYYLCVDNARFFNHSDSANCASTDYDENNLGYTRATSDIQIGEEMTDDYSNFGFDKNDNLFNADSLRQ